MIVITNVIVIMVTNVIAIAITIAIVIVIVIDVLLCLFVGNVRFWNDSRIINDNVSPVKDILSQINRPIVVVVRTDSSGTTSIFTTALASFDPARPSATFDTSFASRVGASEKPSWCDPLTDEIQYIRVRGCDSNLSSAEKELRFLVVSPDYVIRSMNVSCDATAENFKAAFASSFLNRDVYVSVGDGDSTDESVIMIGYLGSVDSSSKKPRNWYQPYLLSVGGFENVSLSTVKVEMWTKQEGGYSNLHFNYASKPVLGEVRSVWIDVSTNFSFALQYGAQSSSSLVSQLVTAQSLSVSLNTIAPNVIASVTRSPNSGSRWVEFQITFKVPSDVNWIASSLRIDPLSISPANRLSVAVMTLTTSNNIPIFYDKNHATGFSNSGRYSCYKREHNYAEFSYLTGNLNFGVVSQVLSNAYSIGYSVLGDATLYKLAMASMINLSGSCYR